jgi:CBS domain containing-hemolysin-like protein
VCIDDDWDEILETIENAPFSRIPVYEDSVDDIIGVLYLNHFFKALLDSETVDIRGLLMEPLYVYKTTKLPAVLNQLRKKQKHLAIVTDEYGGTLGIVTLEDVLEQIVGDIWDETDEVENEIVEREDGIFELDGDLPIGDLAELLDMSEDALETDSATVGGWTMEKYGSFPSAGDFVVSDGLEATVLAMAEDGRRVDRLLIEKLPEEE